MGISKTEPPQKPVNGNVSPAVRFREALSAWAKIGLINFGGPAGQIALMHKILVEEKRWISESRFLHALNYCMLLPGPEAQQLATYIGWLLHRTIGGLAAGILFVLPGALVMLGLSVLYASYRDLALVNAIFFGIKAAVLAVVVEAVLRIGRRALRNYIMIGLAGLAFIAIFFFAVPFPLIVLGAAIIGYFGARWRSDLFSAVRKDSDGFTDRLENYVPRGLSAITRALKIIGVCSLLWFGPILFLATFYDADHVYVKEGLFFSKMAVVTFGGAYAVLAYVAQQAVEVYAWLSPSEMLDGLGLAETTPGPLIMVVQFVGFLGAYRNPGVLDPMLAGTLGALLTTWVTFVPCFLWIFLGAPYVEALRSNRRLAAALAAITAAVVGVILNLAIWFGLHTIFGKVGEATYGALRFSIPDWSSIDAAAALLALAALIAMLRFRLGMLPTLLGTACLGVVWHVIL